MIQRRQNLYLGLVIILSLILSVSTYSIAELGIQGQESGKSFIEMSYSSNKLITENVNTEISQAKIQFALLCVAIFALFAILSFKKLKRQITFCSFNLAFILFLPIFFYIDYSSLSKLYDINSINFMGTAIIPIALLLLNILAIRGVVRDYNLLKSMDRIR